MDGSFIFGNRSRETQTIKATPAKNSLPILSNCGISELWGKTCYKLCMLRNWVIHGHTVPSTNGCQIEISPAAIICAILLHIFKSLPKNMHSSRQFLNHAARPQPWHTALKYYAHDPPAYSNTSCEQQSEAPTIETQRPG